MIQTQQMRIGKSHSLLLSLYSLAFLCGIVYLLLSLLTVGHVLTDVSVGQFSIALKTLRSTVYFVLPSLLISLPFAISLTFIIVSDRYPFWTQVLSSVLTGLSEFPLLLFGLSSILILQASFLSFLLVFTIIAVTRLTSRWVNLLSRVHSLQLESAKALGLNVYHIVFHIYWRRFYKTIFYHTFSVFFILLGLVTPFVGLGFFSEKSQILLASQLFFNLGDPEMSLSVIFLVLLFFHCLRLFFDHQSELSEVDNV